MGYFFGISAAVLLIGAMLALLLGFSKEYKGGVPIPAERRRARIIKGLAVAALCVAIGAVVAVTMFEPWVVDSRLAEAEKITRDTFRQRFGREAGAVTFDRTNRKSGDGWQYAGTADLDGVVWDVTVTRDNYKTPGKTTLQFEATPRK